MATANPFGLLGADDSDDPSQFLAFQQQKISAKKPAVSAASSAAPLDKFSSKPLPPEKSVRESRNSNTAPVRGGTGQGWSGGGRGSREAGFAQNRDSGSRSAIGFSGDVQSEDGVTEKISESGRVSHGPPRHSFRGGRDGGSANRDAEGRSDPDHPQRRVYDRRSGTGRGFEMKREGAGRGNWGTVTDDFLAQETEKGVDLNEKAAASEKLEQKEEAKEKEPEYNEMTLEEYQKVREEKRKALLSMKIEGRKVEFDKDFESMQQLSPSKFNDGVFIKAAMSINEFLKPPEGGWQDNPRARDDDRGHGLFRGINDGGGGAASPTSHAAPLIEDPVQFPALVAK